MTSTQPHGRARASCSGARPRYRADRRPARRFRPRTRALRGDGRHLREDLVVPAAVLIEVDYWLLKLYGPEPWQTFVEDIANGAYRLHPLGPQTLTRAAELEQEYPSLDLGLVDASVIATCEELDESKLATFDRHDFAVVRPRHRDHLILLPE
jgi:predicted nucleic acid-binding protein